MSEAVKRRKAAAENLAVPTCPKCGRLAKERRTRYGIRSECCDLWSWDRKPLVDEATHKARKEVFVMLDKMSKTITTAQTNMEIMRRTKITNLTVSEMNEVTCRKVLAALEDILVDVIAGDVKITDPPQMARGGGRI